MTMQTNTAEQITETEGKAIGTATYSPDDNKLRLYPFHRLAREDYDRLKAAGFKWAPKQELFVAPKWTPGREDLLIELCGEVDDDDTSLLERAEGRADRFAGYSEKRQREADAAYKGVRQIADNIPFGQPILIGHHSERRARKDAERIQNGMRNAVKKWETSQYWTERAASAVAHAEYKELPAVRHRRIKGIESERRRTEKAIEHAEQACKAWSAEALTTEQAQRIAYDFSVVIRVEGEPFPVRVAELLTAGKITAQDAAARGVAAYTREIARQRRWLAHYDNRLAYERAMLSEAIGGNADAAASMDNRFPIERGGRVLVDRGEWLVVLRVNRANGAINSVTTNAPAGVTWSKTWKYGIEKVKDYRAPEAEDAKKAKAATALPPICNYPGEGFREMTQEQWDKRPKWSDFPYISKVAATETHGAHRARFMPVPGRLWEKQQVFITDAKRKDPPAIEAASKPVTFAREVDEPAPRAAIAPAGRTVFDDMQDTLKAGVQVVAAPQLFPTPAELVAQMIELADIQPGQTVLEPSAGTGAILSALPNVRPGGRVVAVEINATLAAALDGLADEIRCADFLACDDLGDFDVIVMNPPFAKAVDILHIEHAATMLKPGGRLVAICANGPRQNERLKPNAVIWRELPAGTFKESGTGVNAVLLVIERGE